MHCHISEFQQGTYKKAHRHNAGAHIFCVTGEGYSLLWHEGDNPVDTVRVDWKPGTLYAPPDGPTYHQHFNSGTKRARYMALRTGDGGFNAPNAPVNAVKKSNGKTRLGTKYIGCEKWLWMFRHATVRATLKKPPPLRSLVPLTCAPAACAATLWLPAS